MQHLKTLLLVLVFFSVNNRLNAVNPPPVNDTVCDAIDLGLLPIPGPCPSYPYGDTVLVIGTTDWATMNSFDFSPVSCFPNGSPDVWYKFRSTGNYIYIELFGSGDLDSMFCKLYTSNGSCIGLIPGHCETTFNGTIMAAILTPDIGGEYYLQIGGSTYDETGTFYFTIKSFNDCGDCVKNSHVELDPAPWFGRYGTSDTVTMCYTVDRWDQTTTAKLHAVVPEFGDEWDTTSLVPVSAPSGNWMWGNNIPTPIGSYDGFYYDGNSDGDPTNNPGQSGNVTTSWEFCWSITTKPFCNAYDAHVQIFTFSDNQTGSGNSVALCNEAVPMYLSMSGWCCPDPIFSVTNTGGCSNVSQVVVDPVSVVNGDTFNITVYDDTLGFYAYQGNVTGQAVFTLPSGDYLFEVHNASINCPSFHVIHIPGAFTIDIQQTVVGCGPGSGSAVATPVGATGPYTYVWPNITTYNDSLAFSLSVGYAVVAITDGAGCTITDSIYITVLPTPDAYFDYQDVSYCHNDDTMQVWTSPATAGGTFQLLTPLTTPITVDPNTGTIALNGATVGTPYWIKVRYSVGSVCMASFVDSIQIVQQPSPPIASSPQTIDWCIGNTAPTLSINIGAGIPLWSDATFTQTGFGYTFNPALSGSTAPGAYLYGCVYLADLTAGCSSLPTFFTVNAQSYPSFTMGPDVTICPGDTAALMVTGTSGTYNYQWTPMPTVGPDNIPITATAPAGTTTYSCVITDGLCSLANSITVFVDSSIGCGITLYNGITPNGDGLNDRWIIESAFNSPNMTVCIYNRWGAMVWKANNYNNTSIVFEGRSGKGEDLPSGTYYFTIQQDNRGTEKGWLELTR
jgi:gliding motility-associated-like protein